MKSSSGRGAADPQSTLILALSVLDLGSMGLTPPQYKQVAPAGFKVGINHQILIVAPGGALAKL